MPGRVSTCLLTIVTWILLSVVLDAGRGNGQASSDGTGPADRRWMPMPLFPPGALVEPLVGDPFREAGYMYVRFPAGYEPPLHSHRATERIYVGRGTLLLHQLARDPVLEPEGAYVVIKSGTVHETACVGPADCFCYISVDRAVDVILFRGNNRF